MAIGALHRFWNQLHLDIFFYLWIRWNLLWKGQNAVIIISGFPATGKTSLAETAAAEKPLLLRNRSYYSIVDLDSSSYSHLAGGERNPNFPLNYLQAISERAFSGCKTILLISTHEEIRRYLVLYGFWFYLVYPQRTSRTNTRALLEARGDHDLAQIVDRNFDYFAERLERQGGCEHRRLREGEFLAHAVDEIVEHFETRR